MNRYLSETLAAEIRSRAENRCEYCLISIECTYFGGEIDHIKKFETRRSDGYRKPGSRLSAMQPK